MDTRTRNIIAVVLIAALTVSAFVFVTFLAPSTHLHYESNYSGSATKAHIMIAGIQDCVFTLEFEDDEDLLYRIDVELYDASEVLYFTHYTHTTEPQIQVNSGNDYGKVTRAKSMTVVLGTGIAYMVQVGFDTRSSNITGTVVFDNNVTLGNGELAYGFPGHLDLEFTENVDYSQGGLEILIGQSNNNVGSVAMLIDLPDGMDGDAVFNSASVSVSATGWTLYSQSADPPRKSYRTSDSPTQPLLDISRVYADSIVATLTT
ncbi:MAG: hypothetical protein ACXADC_01240 [Candidatus Thorarchaeota archaeon]|jgi:hypothetical protein